MQTGKIRKIIIGFIFILIAAVSILLFKINNQPPDFNIVLITIDTLRSDHLGCYGYKLSTSPNIDGIAKQGTLFLEAVTHGSKTVLALPSLHTATYPRTHGVYIEGQKMNPSLPTLSGVLRKNGYRTAAVVFPIKGFMGLEKDFDSFVYVSDTARADETTREAVSWLEKNHQNKFFLWLHYFDPHSPYRPPPPYKYMFTDNSKLGRRHIPIGRITSECFNSIPPDVAEGDIRDVDYYISQYDGEIGFTDEQIGILLKKMKELNLDDKTIFVITSDHGELLGEHERYFMHLTLYDENIRVPLIIKCKGILPASKMIREQAESIDIVPTILELLRIPKDRHMQGRSLLPIILGKRKYLYKYAFSEHSRPANKLIKECVRTSEWKLIYTKEGTQEKFELYALGVDPGESNNLINVEKERSELLKEKLNNWRRRIPAHKSESFPIDEADARLLKSLGYLQ